MLCMGFLPCTLPRLAGCCAILRCLGFLSWSMLLVVAATAPALAQQCDLNAIQNRFNELYTAGNYPAALVEAQKLEAGVKARLGVNHRSYAVALGSLGIVYHAQGKYADAE